MLHTIRALFSGDQLKARALRSTGFIFLQTAGSQGLRLIGNLILTRLLFPEAFGIMALIMVLQSAVALFSDLGVYLSILQNDRNDRRFLNTAWTIQIIRGVILWAAACALAWPMAEFYEVPELAWMIPVSTFAFVIDGLIPTRMYSSNRDLVLGRVTYCTLGSHGLGLMVTIALASALNSAWALVIGGLIGNMIRLYLMDRFLPGERDRLDIERAAFFDLFHFGKWLILGSIAGFFGQQGDRLLLGKVLSLGDLAMYGIALTLARLPIQLGHQLGNLVFIPMHREKPARDSAANRRNLALARCIVILGSIAVMLTLALVGDWLVRLLYDLRYEDAGPNLVMLALALIPNLFTIGYVAAHYAGGNSRVVTIQTILVSAIQFGLMLALLPGFGIAGIGLAIWLAPILTYPVVAYQAHSIKAWNPLLDLMLFGGVVLGSAGVLWLHRDNMAALLPQAFGV